MDASKDNFFFQHDIYMLSEIFKKMSWKTTKNTLINLYCINFLYCNNKIVKN